MDKTKDIVTELKKSYAIELETIQNYLANSVDLDGAGAEEVKKSLEEEIATKLKHGRHLAKRIKVLGGRVPGSLELPRDQNLLQPPFDSADVLAVIRGVIGTKEAAISQYQKIITLTDGLDYVTQDLVIDLLSDEQEHLRLFLSFLAQHTTNVA
ncbi:MAG TPA: ferritin-like domain-containing protein [Chthoniobacterales bacterium]